MVICLDNVPNATWQFQLAVAGLKNHGRCSASICLSIFLAVRLQVGQFLIIALLSRCWTFSPRTSSEASLDPSSDTVRCPPISTADSPRHTVWDTSCGCTFGFTTYWAVGDPRHITWGTSSDCTSGFTSARAVGDPRPSESPLLCPGTPSHQGLLRNPPNLQLLVSGRPFSFDFLLSCPGPGKTFDLWLLESLLL